MMKRMSLLTPWLWELSVLSTVDQFERCRARAAILLLHISLWEKVWEEECWPGGCSTPVLQQTRYYKCEDVWTAYSCCSGGYLRRNNTDTWSLNLTNEHCESNLRGQVQYRSFQRNEDYWKGEIWNECIQCQRHIQQWVQSWSQIEHWDCGLQRARSRSDYKKSANGTRGCLKSVRGACSFFSLTLASM